MKKHVHEVDTKGCRPENDQTPFEILEEHGNVKYVYVVSNNKMNQMVKEFMNNPREWTAYPADRLEVIARHNNAIPQNAHYARFDVDINCLVFIVNNRSHGEPRWLDKAKNFIQRLFG